MRVGPDGRVTIPQDIRDALGLAADTEVEFVRDADGVRLVRVGPSPPPRGEQVLAALRGAATSGLTGEELLGMTREP